MQALAFDFDGLILDTETPELKVWTEVFEAQGVQMPEGYWTQVIGRGAEQEIERPHQLLSRLSGNFVETPEKATERRAKILSLIEREDARPGIRQLIQDAKAAKVPIGIVSSSKHAWVDLYLGRLGLLESFDCIVCADDVTRAKPFPDLYLLFCRRLNVSPVEAVALEDSPNGVAAAKAAGLYTIAVPNSVTAPLDLSAADFRIDDLTAYRLKDLVTVANERKGAE